MTMTFDQSEFQPRSARRRETPVAVQILSTLMFGAYAIVAVVMAFVHFWPACVIIAIVLAWRGGFGPENFTQANVDDIVSQMRDLGPEAQQRRSGNSSFDAYRSDVLERLENEHQSFEGFLGRLREAKDQSEFDRFMDQRAKANQSED